MPIHILLPVAALLAASLPASFQEPLDPFQALEERGTAETFLAMMEATGLRAELAAGGSPFTLLAPVDSAFSGISPEVVARLLGLEQRPALRGLLNDHVLLGSFGLTELISADRVACRSGSELPVQISGGKLTIGGVAIAPGAATEGLVVTGGAFLELEGLILLQPSLLEPTPARRLAARGLRLASELPAEGDAAMAARSAVLEMATAAALECATGEERVLLGPASGEFGSPASADQITLFRAPLLRLLGQLPDGIPAMASMNAPKDDARTLVSFDGTEGEPEWFTLNDDVMGGRSTSTVKLNDGRLLFTGSLSLENNGGFASIRSTADTYDLSESAGLRLRVRTDGREYGVNVLAGSEGGRSGSWRKRFQVPAGEWTTVDIPFQDMVLSIRGREYPQVGPPDLAAIRSFSFIIGDKDVSPFQIEIESISAYR